MSKIHPLNAKWEQVDMSKHSYGSLGIGTPSQVKWDASAPLTMGKPVERIRFMMSNQEPEAHVFAHPTTEWARVDKDLNVTHLDIDLCAKGPQNVYTALALAIWNKAIAHEREECAKVVEEYCGAWNDEGYALASAIRARK